MTYTITTSVYDDECDDMFREVVLIPPVAALAFALGITEYEVGIWAGLYHNSLRRSGLLFMGESTSHRAVDAAYVAWARLDHFKDWLKRNG